VTRGQKILAGLFAAALVAQTVLGVVIVVALMRGAPQ
jgi:hypothetical protein